MYFLIHIVKNGASILMRIVKVSIIEEHDRFPYFLYISAVIIINQEQQWPEYWPCGTPQGMPGMDLF